MVGEAKTAEQTRASSGAQACIERKKVNVTDHYISNIRNFINILALESARVKTETDRYPELGSVCRVDDAVKVQKGYCLYNGRPRKYSFEEKRIIIEWYLAIECSGDVSMLKEHGIYTKIALFARSSKSVRGIPHVEKAKDTDFSKDPEIRAYIDECVQNAASADIKITECAYVPLDVGSFLRKTPHELRDALTQYNQYNQSVYMQAAKAIEEHLALCRKVDHMQHIINDLQDKINALSNQLASEVNAKKAYIQRTEELQSFIKKKVTPAMRECIDGMSDEERFDMAALFADMDLSTMHERVPASGIDEEPQTNVVTPAMSNVFATPEDHSESEDGAAAILKKYGITKENM